MTLKDHGIINFSITELAPPQICSSYSESRILHWFDMRIVKAWQWIRSQRGHTIYMNTWGINAPEWYPEMTGRGLRIPSKKGHNTSQHYYGRALDGDEPGVDNKELYQFCLDNGAKLLSMGVTTIEHIDYTPTWVHLDCRTPQPNQSDLYVVSP